MLTFRRGRREVYGHTLGNIRMCHVNYGIGTAVAKTLVPRVNVWGVGSIVSKIGREIKEGEVGKDKELSICKG